MNSHAGEMLHAYILHSKIQSFIYNIYSSGNFISRTALHLPDLDFSPGCKLRAKEAVSAVHRATTQTCKSHIINITCALQRGDFYPEALPDLCPRNKHLPRQSLGCFRDKKNFRLLSGYYVNYKETNEPDLCVNMCLQGGFPFAGVQYS